MLAVLVHKDNPDVRSDPTIVTPGGTHIAARKDKEKAYERGACVIEGKLSYENSWRRHTSDKQARIQGMRSHVTTIEIDAIIAQVSALRENKDVLIGSLGREGYDAQITHLLGQLPGLSKKDSHGVGGNVGDGSCIGDNFWRQRRREISDDEFHCEQLGF